MDTIHWTLPWECATPSEDKCGWVKFGIHRPSDGRVTAVREHCDKLDCENRNCRIAWMRRQAERATVRIIGGLSIWEHRAYQAQSYQFQREVSQDDWKPKRDKSGGFNCAHYSLSFDDQDWESYSTRKGMQKKLTKMRTVLKEIGIKGHMEVFHSHRSPKERAKANHDDSKYMESMEKVTWEWGPHWHLIGQNIFITDEHRKLLRENGIILKWLRAHSLDDTDALYRNVFYELTHAGVPMRPDGSKHRLEIVKWVGGMAKNKLRLVELEKRQEISFDSETLEELEKVQVLDEEIDYVMAEPWHDTATRVEKITYDMENPEVAMVSLPSYRVWDKDNGYTVDIDINQTILQKVTYKHYSGEMRSFDALCGRFSIHPVNSLPKTLSTYW